MASIKLRVIVNELSNVLTQFDEIKVYRSTTVEAGPYSEITGPGTRVPLVAGTTLYEYIDAAGDPAYWYRFAFYNSVTAAEGTASEPIRGEGVLGRYATIQDVRDEGVTDPPYDDTRISNAIALASQQIEMFTGRWFEPRAMTFTVDGSGKRSIHLDIPIVEVTEVKVDDVAIAPEDLIVYNRHLAEGLLRPDDRDNPRIELLEPLDNLYLFALGIKVWPPGQRNVEITGTFGYTDPDGTASGKTPDLIRRACVLLVLRLLPQRGAPTPTVPSSSAWRVSELRTRDQTIKFAAPSAATLGRAGVGIYTGDPEIDQILLRYRRAPMLRAV